eukprot:3041550-Pyramimonas_sp.AAC.1
MKGVSHRRDEAGFSSTAGTPRDRQQATTFAGKRHSSFATSTFAWSASESPGRPRGRSSDLNRGGPAPESRA